MHAEVSSAEVLGGGSGSESAGVAVMKPAHLGEGDHVHGECGAVTTSSMPIAERHRRDDATKSIAMMSLTWFSRKERQL